MFKKVLIANRGEIACRIIKTLRKMGIGSVAIYSEADRNALHVSMADESYCVGKAIAAKSYLNIEKIIEVIKESGADAVHPGYGFLSENSEFVKALDACGVTFIGPSTDSVKVMGDKITAKEIASKAEVSILSGFLGNIDGQDVQKIVEDIGLPVIIKAAAGGGGKGMRVVRNISDLDEAIERSVSEAVKSFKDGRVFIERYLENPRHIEIQVLADKHSNVLFLGERECSIQRNHQKVIEESPSVLVTEDVRQEMYAQCKRLVEAVGYYSAGTVEFVMDQNRNFYFLEMNTRLQVEHPVTELVTGIDIVEQMVNIAADKPLEIAQSDIKINGWAIESRIYAEDPSRNFIPCTGHILKFSSPENSNNFRIDTGVQDGSEISMYYDPMISKSCSWGENRDEAIRHMRKLLSQTHIEGLITNISFLERILYNKNFCTGDISTNFIKDEFPDGVSSNLDFSDGEAVNSIILFSAYLNSIYRSKALLDAGQTGPLVGDITVVVENTPYILNIMECRDNFLLIMHNEKSHEISMKSSERYIKLCKIDGYEFNFKLFKDNDYNYLIGYKGYIANVFVVQGKDTVDYLDIVPSSSDEENSDSILSPITGMVTKLCCKVGQSLEPGDVVCVIEAMKMENNITASRKGKIKEIFVSEGGNVQSDDKILDFESDSG